MKKIVFILLFMSFFVKAQSQQENDTLFIKYDKKLLKRLQDPVTKEINYFVLDKDKDSGYMFFLEKQLFKDLTTKSKIYCLNKLLKKSKAYKNSILDDYVFFNYLSSNFGSKTKWFFVKNNLSIEVDLIYAIDD